MRNSLQLNTRAKLCIARALYRMVSLPRRLTGLTDVVQVERRGLHWRLDLSEGIDLALFLFGCFECATVRTYERLIRPGATVLDIGANIGAHTLPLAQLAGSAGCVIAFEPTRYAFAKLAQNVSLNPGLAHRIRPEQLMLTDATEGAPTPKLYSSWPLKDVAEPKHAMHQGVLADTSGAVTSTLDDYVHRHRLTQIDFIKIDVDGNEHRVLRGARQTLKTFRPGILIEFMPHGFDETGGSFSQLVEFLKTAGYRFLSIPQLTPLPEDITELQRLIPAGGSINVICQAR